VKAGHQPAGDAALWLVEAILAGAVDAGCDPEQAVQLYRHIWYYTVGEILVRSNRTRRRVQLDGNPTYREQVFAHLDPGTYPYITALADHWPAITSEDTYAAGLEAIINGMLGSAQPPTTA
jgi:hypothetical protein